MKRLVGLILGAVLLGIVIIGWPQSDRSTRHVDELIELQRRQEQLGARPYAPRLWVPPPNGAPRSAA